MVTHFRAVGRPLRGLGVAGAQLATDKPLRCPAGKHARPWSMLSAQNNSFYTNLEVHHIPTIPTRPRGAIAIVTTRGGSGCVARTTGTAYVRQNRVVPQSSGTTCRENVKACPRLQMIMGDEAYSRLACGKLAGAIQTMRHLDAKSYLKLSPRIAAINCNNVSVCWHEASPYLATRQ
jgi:hypothetical protein